MAASPPLPDPRSYPGQRWVRIAARTAHLGAMAMVLGAAALGADPGGWGPLVVLSGLVIVADDLFKWGGLYLRMVQAWVVGLKLVLLVVGLSRPTLLLPCLWAALVAGSVVSHAPGKLRHYRPL